LEGKTYFLHGSPPVLVFFPFTVYGEPLLSSTPKKKMLTIAIMRLKKILRFSKHNFDKINFLHNLTHKSKILSE